MSLHLYAATSNRGKLREFKQMAGSAGVEILPMPENLLDPPMEETGETFSENARLKAEGYSLRSPGQLVFADDSGLCVDALNGAPGVHSARYATMEPGVFDVSGESVDAMNNERLLRELAKRSIESRKAKFVCVIAVALDGKTLAEFIGEAEGEIIDGPRGTEGFGYDPLFYFPSLKKTFAELSPIEKANHSHRGAAFKAMLQKKELFTAKAE